MQKLFICFSILFVFLELSSVIRNSSGQNRRDSDTLIIDIDTLLVDIDTLFDQAGRLDGYSTRIKTPVCEVDKCYAIEIIFHWDLIGRFLKYDTISEKGLTKLDHIPYTQTDYEKLQIILKNENSALRDYQKDQLVKDTRISEIDGFTGATIKEVRDNVIEGAVYSCYTLWHLAYGKIKNDLQQITRTSFKAELVQKMVTMNDQQVNYFLINNFSAKEFSVYFPMILQTIAGGKGYFPKTAIEKMPASMFDDDAIQNFFANEFNGLNYFAQLVLLKKLKGIALNDELKRILKQSLESRNSSRNELLKEILNENN